MIFDMGKRLVAGAGIIALVTLMGCEANKTTRRSSCIVD